MDLKVTPMQLLQQTGQKPQVTASDTSFRYTLLNTLEENELKAGLATMMEDITQQGYKLGKRMDVRDMKLYRKLIKEFINEIAEKVNADNQTNSLLKVVFIRNYNVSYAEKIVAGTDVSLQVSTAGLEASGTGNMKFMINGALTIGTLDGANVEMSQAVGKENIFIFGLKSEEVDQIWQSGYNAGKYYSELPKLRRIVEALIVGFNGESFSDIANYLLTGTPVADPYMCMADFSAYSATQQKLSKLYVSDKNSWNQKSLRNIAAAGIFAADRAVKEYAQNIWNLKPVKTEK